MECLDANVVQDLMAGALEGAVRDAVVGHLDTCDECRQLISVTARDTAKMAQGEIALEATAMPEDIGLDATVAPVNGLDETAMPVSGMAETVTSDARAKFIRPNTAPGNRLGRYNLLEKLGAGAMGIVWRAEDPELGRKVALKLLKRPDPALIDRLKREAQSMAAVNHPNVVTVYEVGTGDGDTFIAMELVEGQSLRAWQAATRHTVPELVEAYIAAGRGLSAAHAAGIIHRDFKPDNVLVGNDGRVRVTDFGLAAAKQVITGEGRVGGVAISDVKLTTSGSVLGTPAYMAPEQFVGGNVDPRTDQFNFCVALYEALYGERPFEGKTFEELGDNVCEGRVKPAPAKTSVSNALREIVLRGMAVKPGDRYPTMDALIVDLGRDRAKPWRVTAIASTALAAALGLGLLSDFVVRDRVTAQISESFALTGQQIRNTAKQATDELFMVSAVAYREQALREVAAHHDQAEFGLGDEKTDRENLERLHKLLVSTDWVKLPNSQLAIGDYKGRLLYTSAAPEMWDRNLTVLAPIKRAIDAGKGDTVTVFPSDDPAFVESGLLGGKKRADALAFLFVRTVSLGNQATDQNETRALYLHIKDGAQLLSDVRLDEKTQLSLVAPDGHAIGALSPELRAAAPVTGEIAEVSDGGKTYLVQSRDVSGFPGQGTIARVVMARPLDGVLTFFPGARTVFAIAMFFVVALALGTTLVARRITGARV